MFSVFFSSTKAHYRRCLQAAERKYEGTLVIDAVFSRGKAERGKTERRNSPAPKYTVFISLISLNFDTKGEITQEGFVITIFV